jgi:hypothetical protein
MNVAATLLVKNVLTEIEPWTGWLASLRVPGYSDDPNVVGEGDGVYTAEDWSNTRRKGLASFGTDGTQFDDNQKYLGYIFGPEGMNVIGAIALARAFDLRRFRSIYEIGCGDMAQAYVLHQLYPQTRYVATDLDPYVIERCARLSVLDGVEKGVVDVLSVTEASAPFAGFDLLMSWGMEYALNDDQLQRLMDIVARNKVPYLMCSATTIGLGKYLWFLLQSGKRNRLLRDRRLRLSGWQRSPLFYARLARRTGLRMRPIGRFGYHYCMYFEPRNS